MFLWEEPRSCATLRRQRRSHSGATTARLPRTCTLHRERAHTMTCPRLGWFSPRGFPDLFNVKDPVMSEAVDSAWSPWFLTFTEPIWLVVWCLAVLGTELHNQWVGGMGVETVRGGKAVQITHLKTLFIVLVHWRTFSAIPLFAGGWALGFFCNLFLAPAWPSQIEQY